MRRRVDFAELDAVETALRIKRREVSAREVVDAAIARAEKASHLGAIVTDTFEQARRQAPRATGPLAGVPTFVKDLASVAGVRTTWGSRASGHHVAKRNDPFVTRIERAGLVSLGKSATPELGLTATTEPLGRDPAKNPWDTARSTGGSSGGAACLVAAGVVPLAHASDGGGSIRIPAACCGLVGLKPSRGIMDMEGSNLLPVNIAVHGVVTRTVRDTIAFHDALDPERSRPARDPKGLRVAVFTNAPTGTVVSHEVRDAVLGAARTCESLGHRVDEMRCPFSGQIVDDFLAYWGFVAWIQIRTARAMLHRGFDTRAFEPWTLGIARTFTKKPRAAFAGIRRLRAFARTYARFMQDYDVIVGPVLADAALPLGAIAPDQPFELAFERIRSYVPVTGYWNAAGAPAISLPLGCTSAGLPIGVQFAAARGNDRLLLDLARTLEAAKPWPRTAPASVWARDPATKAA